MSLNNPFQQALALYSPPAGGFQKTYTTVTTATNQIDLPFPIDFTYMEIWGFDSSTPLNNIEVYFKDNSNLLFLGSIAVTENNGEGTSAGNNGIVVRKLDADTYIISKVSNEGQQPSLLRVPVGAPFIRIEQFSNFPLGLKLVTLYQ